MIPEPVPTDASGIEVVGIEIYSFPAGTVAVSNWEDGTKCECTLSKERPLRFTSLPTLPACDRSRDTY